MSVKKIRFRSSLENDALYKVSSTVTVLYRRNCNGPSVNACTVIITYTVNDEVKISNSNRVSHYGIGVPWTDGHYMIILH